MSYSYHPFPIGGSIRSAFGLALLIVILYLLRGLTSNYFIPISIILAALVALRVFIYFFFAHFQTVTLEEKTFVYASGILSHKQVTLPYSKITEANYSQGILERLLGIAILKIDSAGFSDSQIRLADIRFSDVQKTLDMINSGGSATIGAKKTF